MIPLRLIGTQDEGVVESIIRATNRQTEVRAEQFFAVTEFAKQLEAYFRTFANGRKLLDARNVAGLWTDSAGSPRRVRRFGGSLGQGFAPSMMKSRGTAGSSRARRDCRSAPGRSRRSPSHLRRGKRMLIASRRHRSPRRGSNPRPCECRRSGSEQIEAREIGRIHSFMRAADSATKRREAADFEDSPQAPERLSGSRTERGNLRVETLMSIWFMAFYERRFRQYDRLDIERTRIVTPRNMIRAFAFMFLNEPHRTTRNYARLLDRVGTDIFAEGHRVEPYYVAAFSLYKLEYLFRTTRLDPKFKPSRYHVLLAARLLPNSKPMPQMNARDMEKYCMAVAEILWDADAADSLLTKSAAAVETVAGGDLSGDNVRTQKFTEDLIKHFRPTT